MAIQESSLSREEIFITTKLWNADQGYDSTLKACEESLENNNVIEAYSPLTKGTKLRDPKLMELAGKYGKTSAQILIRWVLDQGFVVIPKSVQKNRILENADVFDFSISPDDMLILEGFNENLATGWDLTHAP